MRAGMTRARLGVQDFGEETVAAIGSGQTREEFRDLVAPSAGRGGAGHRGRAAFRAAAPDAVLARRTPARGARDGAGAADAFGLCPCAEDGETPADDPGGAAAGHGRTSGAEGVARRGYWSRRDMSGSASTSSCGPDDPLAGARAAGRLRRCLDGYTDDPVDAVIGLGASSISRFRQGYVQNPVSTTRYCESADAAETRAGLALSLEDRVRARAIEMLMCDFALDLRRLGAEFGDFASIAAKGMDGGGAGFPGPCAPERGRVGDRRPKVRFSRVWCRGSSMFTRARPRAAARPSEVAIRPAAAGPVCGSVPDVRAASIRRSMSPCRRGAARRSAPPRPFLRCDFASGAGSTTIWPPRPRSRSWRGSSRIAAMLALSAAAGDVSAPVFTSTATSARVASMKRPPAPSATKGRLSAATASQTSWSARARGVRDHRHALPFPFAPGQFGGARRGQQKFRRGPDRRSRSRPSSAAERPVRRRSRRRRHPRRRFAG